LIQSLGKRLQPLLSGAVSFDKLDDHTKQAAKILIHFRAIEILQLPKDQRRARIDQMPAAIRPIVEAEIIRQYRINPLP